MKKLIFSMVIAILLLSVDASAQGVMTLMTWNIANLWHVEGEFLRPKRDGSPGLTRTSSDYDSISQTISSIDPAILALQELGSPEVGSKILDTKYELLFSERYFRDLAIKPEMSTDPTKRDIYTALAYDPSRVDLIHAEYVGDLSITEPWSEHKTRAGVAGKFKIGEMEVWVLSVHLKSGCWEKNNLEKYLNPSYVPLRRKEDMPQNQSHNRAAYIDSSCWLLSRQKNILENWLDRKSSTGAEVVILGDFNRRLNNDADYFLASLNDQDPASSSLYRSPFKISPDCDISSITESKGAIDFVLYTKQLFSNRVPITESQQTAINITNKQASDHCPAVFNFKSPVP